MKINMEENLKRAKSAQNLASGLFKAAQGWDGWSHISRDRVLGLVKDMRHSKSMEEAARNAVQFLTPLVPESLALSLSGVADDLGRPGTQIPGIKVSLGSLKESLRSDDSTTEKNSLQIAFVSRLELKNNSVAKGNHWNNVLARNLAVSQSDFNDNKLSLAFFENLELSESKVSGNAAAFSTFRRLQVRTADFTDNKFAKTSLNEVSIVESRLHGLKSAGTHMRGVKFESCDLQGLVFVGCHFENTTFRNVCIDGAQEKPIVGLHVENLVIADCRTVEELLAAAKGAPVSTPASETEAAPRAETQEPTTPAPEAHEQHEPRTREPQAPRPPRHDGPRSQQPSHHRNEGHAKRPDERHSGAKGHGEGGRRPPQGNRRPPRS